MVRTLSILFCTLTFLMPVLGMSAPDRFTYQGQIIKPDGQALEGSNVTFTIDLIEPGLPDSTACVLYSEQHTLNMTGSNGVFAIEVGSGSGVSSDYAGVTTVGDALSNAGTMTAVTGGCVDYTPGLNDGRQLRLTFEEGSSGPITITQNHDIKSVPYAYSAASINGLTPSDLLNRDTSGSNVLTQANLVWLFETARYTELQALINGTSTQYLSGTITSDLSIGSNRITNLGAPTAGTDAANRDYVDQNIGGNTANIGTLGPGNDGQVLTWDGSAGQFVASLPTTIDATKLPLAGGTMTGPIDMGAQNITNGNNVTIGGNMIATGGISTSGTLAFYNASDYVGFQAGASPSNQIWVLPDSDGTSGQVLSTDGSGALSFTSVLTTETQDMDDVYNNGSSVTVDTTDVVYNLTGTNSFQVQNGGSQALTVTSSGFVGIGSENPESPLVVSANGNVNLDIVGDANNTSADRDAMIRFWKDGGQVTGTRVGTLGYDEGNDVMTLTYGTVTGNHLNVNASGRIGIGTTAPSGRLDVEGGDVFIGTGTLTNASGSEDLSVTGNIEADGNIYGTFVGDGSGLTNVPPAAGTILNNGNSGTTRVGTNDLNNLIFETNNTDQARLDVNGNLSLLNENQVRLGDSVGGEEIGLKAPNDIASSYVLTLPDDAGLSGQVLRTNGSGTLSWVTPSTGTGDLLNGGNSGAVVVGSNDSSLALEASGATAVTILGNGNVGIGTTTPQTDLHVSGTLRVDDAGSNDVRISSVFNDVLSVNPGRMRGQVNGAWELTQSVWPGGPSYSFKNDVDTGFASTNTSDTIYVMTGGATAMTFDASQFVGIGTTTPSRMLQVYGTSAAAEIESTTNGRAEMWLTNTEGSVRLTADNDQFSVYAFGAGTHMTVDGPTGNVGIGTSNPGATLDVDGDFRLRGATSGYVGLRAPATAGNNVWTLPTADGASGQALITDGSGNLSWTSVGSGSGDLINGGNSGAVVVGSNDNTLSLEASGATAITILGNGNVGIGSSAPIARMDITAPGNFGTWGAFNGVNRSLQISDGADWLWMSDSVILANSPLLVGTFGSHQIEFGTSNQERMRIDASGSVGIGTSTPIDSLHVEGGFFLNNDGAATRLSINSDASESAEIRFDEGGDRWAVGAMINTMPGLGSRFAVASYYSGGNYQPGIIMQGDGDVAIGTTTPGAKLDVNGDMRLRGATSGYIGLRAPATAGNNIWTLPTADGTSGQALITDGSGNLSWTSVGSGSGDLINGGNSGAVVVGSNDSTLALEASGATAITVLGNGNVGIGTDSPNNLLHVHSSSTGASVSAGFSEMVVEGSSNAGLTILGGNSSGNGLAIGSASDVIAARVTMVQSTGRMTVGTHGSNGYLSFETAVGNEQMRITPSGEVGIGTTNPSAKLDVNGDMRLRGATSGYVGLQAPATAGNNVWTLPTADGTSGQLLQTDGSGNLSFTTVVGGGGDLLNGGNSGAVVVGSNDNTLALEANGSTAMTIDASGNVGVGTTSPAHLLDVDGDVILRGTTRKVGALFFSSAISSYGGLSNTTDDSTHFSIGSVDGGGNHHLVFTSSDNWSKNHDHNIKSTNPTIFLHSATDPDVVNTEYGSFSYLGTGSGSGYFEISTGTGHIALNPVGNVGIGTDNPGAKLDVNGDMRLRGATSGYIGLRAPATAGNNIWTLPTADGGAGQALITDGSGNLSWTSVGSGSGDLINGGNSGAVVVGSNDSTLALEANGSTAMIIDASGNVGIGTSTPASALDVAGITRIGDGINDYIEIDYTGVNSGHFSQEGTRFLTSRISPNRVTINDNGTDMDFRVRSDNDTNALFVEGSTDNVGIGTDLPGAKLDVNGDMRLRGATSGYVGLQAPATAGNNIWTLPTADGTSGQALITDGSGNLSWTSVGSGSGDLINGGNSGAVVVGSNDNTLALEANGSTAMTIDASGNVGIGTTTPNYELDIVRNVGGSGADMRLFNSGGSVRSRLESNPSSSSDLIFGYSGKIGAGRIRYNNPTDTLSFQTDESERMVIDGSGNMGVGTSAPDRQLHVSDNFSSLLKLERTGSNQNANIEFTNSDGSIFAGIIEDDFRIGPNTNLASSPWFTIDASGQVGIGTSTPGLGLEIVGNNQLPRTSGSTQTGALRLSQPGGGRVLDMGATNANGTWFQATNSTDLSQTFPLLLNPRGGNIGIGVTNPGSALDVNGDIRLRGATSGYVGLQAPATAGNNVWTLPTADGTSGQVLQTDGSGTLSWTSVAAGGATEVNGLSDGVSNNTDNNIAIGDGAGVSFISTSALNNTALGHGAMASVSSGDFNVAIGELALNNASSTEWNIAIGRRTMENNTTGSYSVAIGGNAMRQNSSGNYNVAIGYNAMLDGGGSSSSVAVGTGALQYATGDSNTAVGQGAGEGVSSTSTGVDNVFLGHNAGFAYTTASRNTFVGYNAGNSVIDGSDNILIGNNVDTPTTSTSNHLNIGNTIYGNLSTNRIGIGTATPGRNLDIFTSAALNANIGVAASGTGTASISLDASDGDFSGSDYFLIRQNNDLTVDISNEASANMNFGINGNNLVQLTATNVDLGAGDLVVNGTTGNVNFANEIRLEADNGTNYVALKAPDSSTSDVTFVLPDVDGSSGQVLSTDGSGNLSWAAAGGSGDLINGGNSGAVVVGSNDNTLALEASGATAITVLGNGNVGIGSSTPTSRLDVAGNVLADSHTIRAAASTNTGATYTIPDLTRSLRRLTLDNNTTVTLPVTTGLATDETFQLTIKITQDATGGRTLAWASGANSIKWDSGSAPTIATGANEETIIQLFIIGGETTWYGALVWREN
jgi:fibronectin-binding autotransporter adhesin